MPDRKIMKKDFVKILKNKADFSYRPDHYKNNLTNISYVFSLESLSFPQRLKQELLNKKSQGFSGNLIDIYFKNDLVFIGTQLIDRDKFDTFISRQQLIELIDQWEELIKQKPDEIYLYHENNKYWFEPKFILQTT